MPFPIESKLNIAGRLADALSALGESIAMSGRHVLFAADRAGLAAGDLRLSNAGVILRFRSGAGDDELLPDLPDPPKLPDLAEKVRLDVNQFPDIDIPDLSEMLNLTDALKGRK